MGFAPGSTKRMGRPTLELFCLLMSSPRAVPTVARKSGVLTGFSATSRPSALVLPYTAPPLMPPPASTEDHDTAQWSRPLLPLMSGVRPNSPIHTIRVLSSSPLADRSVISVDQ